MGDKKERTLFSREEINKRVVELGNQVSEDYKNKDLVVISLLRGSFIFTSDLVRELSIPVNVDFITTASYGHDEVSTGDVDIVHDLRTEVKGKDILIVDDIIDSGYTLKKVIEHLRSKQANSIKICVMLDKPTRRKVDLQPDYVGYLLSNKGAPTDFCRCIY